MYSRDIQSSSHSELINSEIDLLELEGYIDDSERDMITTFLNELHTLILNK